VLVQPHRIVNLIVLKLLFFGQANLHDWNPMVLGRTILEFGNRPRRRSVLRGAWTQNLTLTGQKPIYIYAQSEDPIENLRAGSSLLPKVFRKATRMHVQSPSELALVAVKEHFGNPTQALTSFFYLLDSISHKALLDADLR
jgi:hypothetical protein